MTKIFSPVKLRFLLVSLTLVFVAFGAYAQESQPWSSDTSPLAPPTGFVNDYAGVIDAATKQQLETKLKNLKDTTNPQVEIAIAVVKTTGDRPIFDYSLAVARGWKIGSKADDSPSALLFVAVDDRKYFTQVSKDLEDELPDGIVGSLQRQYLVPEFKKGNYGKGISDTVDAYIATVQGKSTAPAAAPQKPVSSKSSTGGVSIVGIFCCALIVLVILIIIFSRSKGGPTKGDRGRWGGGGFGSGGGGGGSSALPWIIGGIIGNSLGGSSSGSSSSSDGGSSSGGGGDFGGFGGGGDFGGGGAGGDW
ncbi:hypothetical protein BH10ACI2_BH10ACI2_21030 [soil metagenome]